MLGESGARSLDWLGQDLQRIGTATRLGRWYASRMGLRVLVWQEGGYREVTRIPDAGPIAWKTVAALVPVPAGDSLRVRLSFVADQWRIDRIEVALDPGRPQVRNVPLVKVLGRDGLPDGEALASLQSPDERYLQTTAGDFFIVPGPPLPDARRPG